MRLSEMPCRIAAIIVIWLAMTISDRAQAASPHPDFVDVSAVVPNLVVDLRYLGSDNFVGTRIDGYEKPVLYLTRQAADALAHVQRDLAPHGLGLKVFDGYRPARAVAHFARWAKAIDDIRTKKDFYPEIDKRNLFRDGYLASRSGHSRGSTVDLTLVRLADKRELDMGTPFDFFSARSWPGDTGVSAEAQRNRRLLGQAMNRRGFIGHRKEWWHFTLAREPFPDTYFDFPVR
jgi:D-alanyl-D-alanine dipeptidase